MLFYVVFFRYLYFLQLKNSVLQSTLRCNSDMAVKLASYALQGTLIQHTPSCLYSITAEFGDYSEEKHTKEFLSDYIIFPQVRDCFVCSVSVRNVCLQTIEPQSLADSLLERTVKLYQRHRFVCVYNVLLQCTLLHSL